MNRGRWLLLLALLCLGGAIFLIRTSDDRSPRRPHILIITIDTCRADALGIHGRVLLDGSSPTPVLDAVGQRAQGSREALTVTPLTLPAHSSLFTGLYPDRHGVRENDSFRMPPATDRSFPLLAERLRECGYETAAFISAQPLERVYGLDAGFSTYSQTSKEHNPRSILSFRERSAEETVSEVLEYLRAPSSGAPQFVFVHFFDPHDPYQRRISHPGLPEGRVGDYLSEVMVVDAQVGRLLSAWPHPMEQTLVLVTSDHGEGLGEHGEWTHGHLLHQATLRVPFLLVPPAGVLVPENPNPALLVDVVPTILSVLGLPKDETLDGRSLLEKPPARWTAWAETLYPYYQFQYSHLQAWFDDQRKLVDLGGRRSWYDLSADPSEGTDRAPSDPLVAAELVEGLRYFRTSRAPGKAIDVEVESSAAVPYMGGRPRDFPLEPSEERNRSLPYVGDRLHVVGDLDAARSFLAKRPPEAWNAVPLLTSHEGELLTNPALSFWLARSLQHWGRSSQATQEVRLRKLDEAENRFRVHQERFGDLRASDARIRTLWDRYQITGLREDAQKLLTEADLERAAGVDRPLGRALSAQACEALGDREAAITHLLVAARLDPEDPRFGQDLARLRAAGGSKR